MGMNHFPTELNWEETAKLAESFRPKDPYIAAILVAVATARLMGHEETLIDLVTAYMEAESLVGESESFPQSEEYKKWLKNSG